MDRALFSRNFRVLAKTGKSRTFRENYYFCVNPQIYFQMGIPEQLCLELKNTVPRSGKFPDFQSGSSTEKRFLSKYDLESLLIIVVIGVPTIICDSVGTHKWMHSARMRV